MLNAKQSNRYLAIGVVVSLTTSVVLVIASLAGAVSRMQAFV